MSELKDKLPTLESLKLVNDTLSVKIDDLNEFVENVDGVVVSEEEPTSKDVALWVNLSTGESFKIPEIDDSNVCDEDTWSSKKIQDEISKSIPPTTTSDDGKFLSIVDGTPAWVEVTNGNEVSY